MIVCQTMLSSAGTADITAPASEFVICVQKGASGAAIGRGTDLCLDLKSQVRTTT